MDNGTKLWTLRRPVRNGNDRGPVAFLREISELPVALPHRSGTMIRFTTAQLPNLPAADSECWILLPDGRWVDGHFRRNPANPNISGRELVGWIKSWVPEDSTVEATAHQEGGGSRLRITVPSPESASSVAPSLEKQVVRFTPDWWRRRRTRVVGVWRNKTIERDPRVRKLALSVWGVRCQVDNCRVLAGFAEAERTHLIDVHHPNHVSAGGDDSALNISLVCVARHALIHRSGDGRLTEVDADGAAISVGDAILSIRRDIRRFG